MSPLMDKKKKKKKRELRGDGKWIHCHHPRKSNAPSTSLISFPPHLFNNPLKPILPRTPRNLIPWKQTSPKKWGVLMLLHRSPFVLTALIKSPFWTDCYEFKGIYQTGPSVDYKLQTMTTNHELWSSDNITIWGAPGRSKGWKNLKRNGPGEGTALLKMAMHHHFIH